ncbi:MAG TPA: hypothetical protein VK509_03005 [Polyangiales bacterium]|nr:hypothetical protein [Polyangiales bacterium]
MAWGALLALIALAAASGACGDDNPEAASAGSHARRDGGDGDGALGPGKDSGPAKEPEHELRSGETYLCGYDDDDVIERAGSTTFGEVTTATDERGFALVHHDMDGALQIEAVAIAELAQPSVRLVAAADAPGRALLAASSQRFALLYRAGSKLQARILLPDMAPVTLSEQLAAADSESDDGERFALTSLPDRFVAAWSESDASGTLSVFVQSLGLDGTPLEPPHVLADVAARTPRDLQLARLDLGRVLLAWQERDDAGVGRVMAQALDRKLQPERAPVQLSKNAVSEARFELGAREQSAGLIYQAREGGVRDTVKFRRVDDQGSVSEDELSVVNAPGRARGGAIAAFGQGYAVAYRSLPSLGVDRANIRIAFINEYGRIVYESQLAETSEDGGRASVSASVDGHLLVGWTTKHPSGGATTHAVQLACPGALVLCGGTPTATH